ncbi:MAG: hypothetical protein OXF07_01250 [Rhodobacter sp.]|nr:hypothetical protein [Rhodobacter sp.]MCY4243072.1 hypothetical protein [Rhodobacter sp.]
MPLGDPKDWTDRFRSVDTRFLERIWAVWAHCVAVLPSEPDEDAITINLVEFLSRDAKARRLFHYVEYQYEPFGYTADGTAYSLGRIDMAVLLDQDRRRYLAYECKRLNVMWRGRKRSLAMPYVQEGIRRFMSERYAAGLPVGCMLGYVMDGDARTAKSKVAAAMSAQRSQIGIVAVPKQDRPAGSILRLSSRHRRIPSQEQIEIRHAFLPFP